MSGYAPRAEYETADVRKQMDGKLCDMNHAVDCPRCGHRTASAIFLTSEAVLKWHCWRASCKAKGWQSTNAGYTGPAAVPEKPMFRPNPYPHLDEVICGVYAPYDRDSITHVQEFRAFDGTLLGHQTRERLATGSKRVQTWRIVDRAFYHHPRRPGLVGKNTLWCVEDWKSAEALADHGQLAVALAGTSVTDRFLEQELPFAIWRYDITRFLIALDPGAEAAAATAKRKLQGLLLSTFIAFLPEDIKDMSPPDLKRILDYYAPEDSE